MNVDAFTSILLKTPKLNDVQISNVNKVQEISEKFHNGAGIHVAKKVKVDKDTIVLEAGHQPNFLPYAGVFKKIFMLDFFKKKIESNGKKCVAVFGFADYNLATAHLLYKNKVPALSRTGFQKIGFNVPKDKWKAFNTIAKPGKVEFKKEIANIKEFYLRNVKSAKCSEKEFTKNLESFENEMINAYNAASNFPDVNSFFLSKICSLIGLEVNFFNYTDMQKDGIFIEEWNRIIDNIDDFNRYYLQAIKNFSVDINYESDIIPFWYACNCGGNVQLKIISKSPLKCLGKCVMCSETYNITLDLDGVKKHFSRMSMNAVSRNIIVSVGLGGAMYVSGSGGGLSYGKISNFILDKLGIYKTNTICWKGYDYNGGIIQFVVTKDFTNMMKMKTESLADTRKAKTHIQKMINDSMKRMKAADNANDRVSYNKAKIEMENILRKTGLLSSILSMRPSVVDLIVMKGFSVSIKEGWKNALSEANITDDDGFYIAKKDTMQYNPGCFGFADSKKAYEMFQDMSSLSESLSIKEL